VRPVLERFAARVLDTVHYFGDDVPDYYDNRANKWFLNGGWTEGFWPGLLWQLYSLTREERLAGEARRSTSLVARLKAKTDDHDLGFLFGPSCVLEQQVTGSDRMVPYAVAAAERLAGRYLPLARYIPAHGPIDGPRAGFAIIDTLMNLPLLIWGASQTGRTEWAEAAVETARTIAREHLRADGSCCQVLWLDPISGRTVRREAVMALSVDSCWARGQAWGIHGFAEMHRLTGLPEFRQQAERMAGFFLSRQPPDGLVYHDLDAPDVPDVPKDTSAQAIAAGGLLTLAEGYPGEESSPWRAAAERLWSPLLEQCLVDIDSGALPPRGLLGRGCKSQRKGQGVVSEIVFGDYYLLEGLQRWLKGRGAQAGGR